MDKDAKLSERNHCIITFSFHEDNLKQDSPLSGINVAF